MDSERPSRPSILSNKDTNILKDIETSLTKGDAQLFRDSNLLASQTGGGIPTPFKSPFTNEKFILGESEDK